MGAPSTSSFNEAQQMDCEEPDTNLAQVEAIKVLQ
jgi:hypothetical protein